MRRITGAIFLVSRESWFICGMWQTEIYAFNWLSKHASHHVGSDESEFGPDVSNLISSARRKLLDQSNNLAAAPYSGGPTIQISVIPISISSGSFPAVPDANKKQNQSSAPLHSATGFPHDNQTSQPNSANGAPSKLWKYIIIFFGVVFLAIFTVIMFCILRKRAAKVIKPWKTGISGQLQKAFVTGNTVSWAYHRMDVCFSFWKYKIKAYVIKNSYFDWYVFIPLNIWKTIISCFHYILQTCLMIVRLELISVKFVK